MLRKYENASPLYINIKILHEKNEMKIYHLIYDELHLLMTYPVTFVHLLSFIFYINLNFKTFCILTHRSVLQTLGMLEFVLHNK